MLLQSYKQVLSAGKFQSCVYAHQETVGSFNISMSPHTFSPSVGLTYTATCGVYNGIVYCKCITYICQLCSDSHCTLGVDFMAPFWVIASLQVLCSYQCYEHLYVCEHEVPYRSSNSSPHLSMIVRERWSTMGG